MYLNRDEITHKAARHFQQDDASGSARAYFCPGRVNVIGEHIDYNGGLVMPAAIDLGIMAIVFDGAPGQTGWNVYSANAEKPATIPLGEGLEKDPARGWANYMAGVVEHLRRQGHVPPPLRIYVEGDLPDGSGLSSSAALEILTAYLLLRECDQSDEQIDKRSLALLCQQVENQFIGVNSGIMDQYAVACGRDGHAMMLDCRTVEATHHKLDLKGHQLVVLDTIKERQLADSKYNERRAECDAALALIQARHPQVLDLVMATLEQINDCVPDRTLARRARHVVSEHTRVLAAGRALEAGHLERLGCLLDESHASLKDDYEVTGPELDAIVEEARRAPGCLGARMTGAGFGGCALALVEENCYDDFARQVIDGYRRRIGHEPALYPSQARQGVHQLV